MPIRILLADSSDIVLLGMKQVLNSPEQTVVNCCQSLPDLLRSLRDHQAHMVIASDHLDTDVSVIELVQQVKQTAPRTRLLMLGSFIDGALVHDLLTHGIQAYLFRGDRLSDCLPYAITLAMRERPYLSPTIAAEYMVAMQQPARNYELDGEAYAVLRLLAQGNTVGSIAAHLKVPQRRVYWVREKLRRRFGAVTNEHLISRAAAEGFSTFRD